MTASHQAPPERTRVCIVGSGTYFVSGISYYTYYLTQILSEHYQVSTILMRRLIPRFLYPGRSRVGAPITDCDASNFAPTFDGVDWTGLPSVFRASRFLSAQRPDTVVFQWWTGAVLPWYLLLARRARRLGASVIIELHEDLDSGEAALPVVGDLLRRCSQAFIRHADGYVVHSEWDRDRLCVQLQLERSRVVVIPLCPFPMAAVEADPVPLHTHYVDPSVKTLLFFGTIRPYKGLEDLVDAFDQLPRSAEAGWRLLIVGETWENWTLPLTKVSASPNAEHIEVVNRYVTDDEVPGFFERADVVVLPYLRSSASGPLHQTMARGLPVVVTAVGGLVEAASKYAGAVFSQPADVADLTRAIQEAAALAGQTHADPHTWEEVGQRYDEVISALP